MEKILETKSCKSCDSNFDITDKDLEFYEKVSPVFEGKRYLTPTPTLCPDCRQQRRLSFRNERKLYKRKCDFSGKDIISIYSPDKPYKVYSQEIWWSDTYNPLEFGKDFDFNKTFLEQYKDLFKKVPQPKLYQEGEMINSEYASFTGWLKDCYLVYDSGKSENCMHGNLYIYSKSSVDCSVIFDSENCYEVVNSQKCYNLFFSKFCIDCKNSSFLDTCINCEYCFGCKNLTNKNYCIFNKQFSKEEYFNEMRKYNYSSKIKKQIKKFYDSLPNKNLRVTNCEDSRGDILNNCRSVVDCYECFDMEYCKFCSNSGNNIDHCYDISAFGEDMHLCYELSASGGFSGEQSIYKCMFGAYCFYGGTNLYYCIGAHNNSKNCFGCVGLKGNEYCILNKQYTKEEYNKLVPKIIEYMKKTGEWGEFFPASMSPFGYNETVAQEYFPLTREEVLVSSPDKGRLGGVSETQTLPNPPLSGRGKNTFLHGPTFNWSNYEAPLPKVDKIIPANKLPDGIKDIPDDILNWAIECEITKKPFRIIKEELEFYRKHNLPIPRRHPDQRHLDRMKLRNPRKLYKRKCDKCSKEIQTTYSPEREDIVYCETCYNSEIY